MHCITQLEKPPIEALFSTGMPMTLLSVYSHVNPLLFGFWGKGLIMGSRVHRFRVRACLDFKSNTNVLLMSLPVSARDDTAGLVGVTEIASEELTPVDDVIVDVDVGIDPPLPTYGGVVKLALRTLWIVAASAEGATTVRVARTVTVCMAESVTYSASTEASSQMEWRSRREQTGDADDELLLEMAAPVPPPTVLEVAEQVQRTPYQIAIPHLHPRIHARIAKGPVIQVHNLVDRPAFGPHATALQARTQGRAVRAIRADAPPQSSVGRIVNARGIASAREDGTAGPEGLKERGAEA
ncbi:uncharacterized protein Z519_04421 [Cladophialophora bantiana CBS 173.52]|uniref:Uncharacterized protein n=1 Tax=Cladophialophora bantiana (strain ATCC 10958 / CBS 173.52 / CDC B-1940 / NIH 8579) TaxID=1442370 RepID=A0A0D2HU89_CLAB1|nr:uncharacterized protein Z519_04421 [Cladophialophora bantiana CBS 173.52]KIW94445.1 hypothetical protein Z519_04421 [Cladophialophora bantiana CBS 173.52]